MQVGLDILGHHPIVRAGGNLIRADPRLPGVDPARIKVVSPVDDDLGQHPIAQAEFPHGGVVLGKLLAGGTTHGTDIGNDMIAVTAKQQSRNRGTVCVSIFRRVQKAHDVRAAIDGGTGRSII